MAWNNVFRNAKSTILVFASLFFGLSLFLVVTGLLRGLSPENFVSQWGESDFAITYSMKWFPRSASLTVLIICA